MTRLLTPSWGAAMAAESSWGCSFSQDKHSARITEMTSITSGSSFLALMDFWRRRGSGVVIIFKRITCIIAYLKEKRKGW